KAPMSAPRAALAAAVIGNTLYAMGGGLDSGDPTTLDTLEAYDVTTNSWTTLAHMLTPRSPLAAVGLDGLIYAIVGATDVSGDGRFDWLRAQHEPRYDDDQRPVRRHRLRDDEQLRHAHGRERRDATHRLPDKPDFRDVGQPGNVVRVLL